MSVSQVMPAPHQRVLRQALLSCEAPSKLARHHIPISSLSLGVVLGRTRPGHECSAVDATHPRSDCQWSCYRLFRQPVRWPIAAEWIESAVVYGSARTPLALDL
jgi:hypothetical protein